MKNVLLWVREIDLSTYKIWLFWNWMFLSSIYLHLLALYKCRFCFYNSTGSLATIGHSLIWNWYCTAISICCVPWLQYTNPKRSSDRIQLNWGTVFFSLALFWEIFKEGNFNFPPVLGLCDNNFSLLCSEKF